MSDAATVACKVCGLEVTVSGAATRSAAQLERELPMGWDLREERDEVTGALVVVVLCPNHTQT